MAAWGRHCVYSRPWKSQLGDTWASVAWAPKGTLYYLPLCPMGRVVAGVTLLADGVCCG